MPKRNDEKPEDKKRQREKELQDLWQRRDRLNESEWNRLYKLVGFSLFDNRGRFKSLIKALPEDFDFYFQEFFVQKVFLPARKEGFIPGALIGAGAVRTFFKRFLLDRLDEIDHQPQAFKFLEEENEERKSILDILLSTQTHPDLPDPDWRPSPEQEWRLWDIGLDLSTVIASAKDFFNRLTPEEQLLFNECFFKEKSLSNLKGRVRNVYEKAAKLGIKMRKNEEEYADYRKTQIGLWLTQPPNADPPGLGLSLQSDEIEVEVVFMIVFQTLPNCALGGVNADCRSGSRPHDPPPVAGPSVSPR